MDDSVLNRLASALADRHRLHRDIMFTVVARDTMLADTYVYASNPHANYDVMPDGTHFVFLEPDNVGELIVVANWTAVLRARMAGGVAR